MHFTINANQKQLQKYCPDLNINHYAIINVLKSMCLSHSDEIRKSRITKNERQYTWVDLQHVIDELPCLTFNSTGTLSKRVKEIVSAGLFDKETKGRKMYISPTPKLDKINRQTGAEDGQPFRTRNDTVSLTKQNRFVHETNHNTSNHNTSNPKNLDGKPSSNSQEKEDEAEEGQMHEEIVRLIDAFREFRKSRAKQWYKNTTQREALERLLEEYDVERLERVIDSIPQYMDKQYCPSVDTPVRLEKNFMRYMAFVKKQNNNQVAFS